MPRLLIVDDRQDYLRSLSTALRSEFDVVTAASLQEAKEAAGEDVALALVDVRLSEEDDTNREGLVLLEWLKMNHPAVPCLVMSAYTDFDAAVDALNLGAAYFLRKPIDLRQLKGLLRTFLEQGSLQTETEELRKQLEAKQ